MPSNISGAERINEDNSFINPLTDQQKAQRSLTCEAVPEEARVHVY
jgi:hypothetical protein